MTQVFMFWSITKRLVGNLLRGMKGILVLNVWLQRSGEEPDFSQRVAELVDSSFWNDSTSSLLLHNQAKLEQRCEVLRRAFPPDTLHTVAIKANPLVKLLKGLVQQDFGLEAASLGELELAMAAGCPPHKIVFDSPAKTSDELRFALAKGFVVNANSGSELGKVRELGKAHRLGLRCNPASVGKERESATMVATAGSKFGVALSEVPELLQEFSQVTGLHLHVGSQVASLDDLVSAAKAVLDVARNHPQITWIDIGGGLPTRYKESDPGLEPSYYWRRLMEKVPELGAYRLLTEIGRALQANCGWAMTKAEQAEAGRIIVHLGADFALRECYQSDSWYHQMQLFDSKGMPKGGRMVEQDIFGPLCFSGDCLARGRLLPQAESGDILVIHDCGAYTYSMWSRYCSRTRPAVVGLNKSGSHVLLRAAETAADLVKFWS